MVPVRGIPRMNTGRFTVLLQYCWMFANVIVDLHASRQRFDVAVLDDPPPALAEDIRFQVILHQNLEAFAPGIAVGIRQAGLFARSVDNIIEGHAFTICGR